MWQYTQGAPEPRKSFLSIDSTQHLNIRQFGRRLSHHFTKVIRKWKSTGCKIHVIRLFSSIHLLFIYVQSQAKL